MGIMSWIIAGGIAGWLASMITGTNARMGCLLNIIVGVIGAFIGGLIFQKLNPSGHLTQVFSRDFWSTVVVAFVGATVFLSILRLISRP